MSLFSLFDIGKSAMFASQTALSVTSHNIANVNTPNYSRQEVLLEATNPVAIRGGFLGRGVGIVGIKRHYDRFIENQMISQHQSYGRSYAMNQVLSRIEQIFNEAKDIGIASSLTDFFNAWNEVATNSEGIPQRTALLQKANAMISIAKNMEQQMLDTLRHANEEIGDIVNRINSIASDIASLNGKITQIEAGLDLEKANDLRDQRGNLLNELSNLVEFSSYEDKNGAVNIIIGMRNLVYGETADSLQARMNEDTNNDIYLDNTNISSFINKGQLGGLLAVRDNIQAGLLKDFRKFIASLTKEINLLHSSGYGLDASTGNYFFNQLIISTRDYSSGADVTSAGITNLSALTLNEYDITFDGAGNYYVTNRDSGVIVASGMYVSGNAITFDGIEIVITGTVSATDRFFVSPLTGAIRNSGVAITSPEKIAAASSDALLPADNSNALKIVQLYENNITNLGDATFFNYYRSIVSNVGTAARAASDSVKFDDNLLSELTSRRESVSGVSLDEEAANLIRFQRAFEAGARMIQIADELLEALLNL